MSWIMTIAAGVALGYFLVQYFTKNTRLGQGTEDSPETETAEAEGAAELELPDADADNAPETAEDAETGDGTEQSAENTEE